MEEKTFYSELVAKFREIVEKNGFMDEKVSVTGRVLTPKEAIGTPSREDFPILKGKEKLMQAEFKGEKGQAYTDMPGDFSGTLREILERKTDTNFDKAVLVSTINAVCRHLGIAEGTIHCKDDEPETCSKELVDYIRENYGLPKIAQIGLQPSMLQRLSEVFEIRIVDLDEDNIGKERFGVEIEDAATKTDEILEWCDIVLATGSTAANGSVARFIDKKPVIFYGTTIAGIAAIMGLKRFCECSK